MHPFILLSIVLAVLYVLIWPPYFGKVFAIKIRTGAVKVRKGKPPKRFIAECKQIIRKKVVRGYIYGVREAGELRLEFTNSIPEPMAQRFRNVFPYAAYEYKTSNDKGPLSKRQEK